MNENNIFWKMINNQKKKMSVQLNTPPNIHEFKQRKSHQEIIIPFKQNNPSAINHHRKSVSTEQYEKLSIFQKICSLQYLLKEMLSTKERFISNKSKMIEKLNKNTLKFYQNKIKIKEIYDYIQSNEIEEHINYYLNGNPIELLGEEKYENIKKLFFILRNNNNYMLKIVDNFDPKNYEQLSDFIINFLYEDTINSSFIQDELLLIIYLLIEKTIMEKLPNNEINLDDKKTLSYLFSSDNILYYIFRVLNRKADVRNYLCSVLSEIILQFKSNKEKLLIDLDSIVSDNAEKQKIQEDDDTKYKHQEYIYKSSDENEFVIFETEKQEKPSAIKKLKSLMHRGKGNEKKNESNPVSDKSLNITFNEEPFINNNVDFKYLKYKLQEIENEKKNNKMKKNNDAMKDYLNILINSKKSQNDIYSNDRIINKLIKISSSIDEASFLQMSNSLKKNYKIIIDIITEIIKKIKENFTSIPFVIKYITNIFELLLNKKYVEQKTKPLISDYAKYIFKSNFFFGIILFTSLTNPDYNGVVTTDVIPIVTVKNLNIIAKIFSKLFNGQLFSHENNNEICYTIFNKFIIETMPSIFDIIDHVEKNIKLPYIIQKLVSIKYDVKNNDRENLINYDFFAENRYENIQYQSVCFNFSILYLIINIISSNKRIFISNNKNNEHKNLFETIVKYEKFVKDLYNKDIQDKSNHFFYISKIEYRKSLEIKMNEILKDNIYFKNETDNNNNILNKIKNCIIEVLSYMNIMQKDYFIQFIHRQKDIFVTNNDLKEKIINSKKNKIHSNITNDKKLVEEKQKEINEKHLVIFSPLDGDNEKYDNFEIDFKEEIFPHIMNNIKNEISFNFDNEKSQKIIFCTSFLQAHLNEIPKEYSINNYNKLFMTLIQEVEEMIHYYQNNILNQIYQKFKGGEKLNMIIINNCNQIKNLEKSKYIEYFYYKILVPSEFKVSCDGEGLITKVEYIKQKSSDKKNKIENNYQTNITTNNFNDNSKKEPRHSEPLITFIKAKRNISSTKNDNKENNDNIKVPGKKSEEKNLKIDEEKKEKHISNLLEIIPDFRKFQGEYDDIIKLEENSGVAEALNNYFKSMKSVIRKENCMKRFSKDEITGIAYELENFIFLKLYDKLYPTISSKADIKFYKKCCRLDFVKPHNLITDKNFVNEKLWKISMDYINEMDNKFSPFEKIKCIQKAFSILQNSISFCSGKKELGVDDTINPLIYILLKAKPKNIYRNFNYCQLFLNKDLAKKDYGIVMTQFSMIMEIIKKMKYDGLIGVTKEQFGEDEEDEIKKK